MRRFGFIILALVLLSSFIALKPQPVLASVPEKADPSYLLVTGISAGVAQAVSLTRYTFPCGFLALVSTEANTQLIARDSYTLSNLYCFVNANTITNGTTVRSRIAGANGNQLLSIPASTTGAFTDSVNSDSLVDGNLFDTSIVTPAGGTSIIFDSFSYILTTASNTTPILACTGSASLNGDVANPNFVVPVGRITKAFIENNVKYTFRVASTLSNFRVYCSIYAGITATLRVRINGSNGNEVVSIIGSGAFEDVTNTDSIVVGQTLNFYYASEAGYTPSFTSMQVKSNSAGRQVAVATGGTATLACALTGYLPVEGSSQSFQATEAKAQVTARASFTTKNMFVNVPTNSVNNGSTFNLRYTGGNTGLTVSVPASTTGTFEDITHTYDFVAADLLNWRVVTGGSSGTMVITCIGFELAQLAGGGEPSISNTPGYIDLSIIYGYLSANQTYWSTNVSRTWPLADNQCYFYLSNNGTGAVNISVNATSFTGGVPWTLNTSAGADQAVLKVGRSNIANETQMVTLNQTLQSFITGMASGNTTKWELVLYTPTIYSDGVAKSSQILIIASNP